MSDSPVASIPGLPKGGTDGNSIFWDETVGSWFPSDDFTHVTGERPFYFRTDNGPQIRLDDRTAVDNNDVVGVIQWRNVLDDANLARIAITTSTLTIENTIATPMTTDKPMDFIHI